MRKYLDLFKQTFKEFGEDKAPRLGAALAYYTIFSIAPLLLLAVAISGMVCGQEAAQGAIAKQLDNVMGAATAKSVQEMIANAAKPKTGTMATIISVITLLFGASGVFGQLKDALNTIWNVEGKPRPGIIGFVRNRFMSMAMVAGIGFLLLVTLIIDAVLSAMGDWIGARMPGGEALFHTLHVIVSFAVVTVLFAMIFRILPDLKIAWKDVWLGALITSFLFVLGKLGLGLYLGKAAVGSSYGAAGSLVILLVWVYWSAQILFLGAEFTQVYARNYGSLKGDTSKQQARAQAGRVEDREKPQTTSDTRPGTLAPAYVRSAQPARAKSGGGGKGKLAAGGAIGLVFGALLGGLTALVLAIKSIKKVVTAPLKLMK